MSNIAIIPVRAGSTRVKKKNFVDFFGKPLFLYTYEHALNSNLFDRIVISTESTEVLELCKSHGISIDYVRPDKLSDGDVSLDDVCEDVLIFFEKNGESYRNICLLWATSPMRDSMDMINAYKKLNDNYSSSDCVVAVTHYPLSPYCAMVQDEHNFLTPIMPDEFWKGSHAWPETLVDCGSMSWVKTETFRKEKSWLPKRSLPYRLPRYKAVDVDLPEDLELLRMYFEKYNK